MQDLRGRPECHPAPAAEGVLISIAAQRNGRTATSALVRALTAGVILSLLMELLQHLLPMRAPSRIDWALNSAGTAVGAHRWW